MYVSCTFTTYPSTPNRSNRSINPTRHSRGLSLRFWRPNRMVKIPHHANCWCLTLLRTHSLYHTVCIPWQTQIRAKYSQSWTPLMVTINACWTRRVSLSPLLSHRLAGLSTCVPYLPYRSTTTEEWTKPSRVWRDIEESLMTLSSMTVIAPNTIHTFEVFCRGVLSGE